jgi:protoporphyrinogen oxidase
VGRVSVVVVGAGISGLCAAYELLKAGADVTVLESERRAGGVIVTERPAEGWIVEGGPDSVLAADDDVPRLAGELGIPDRIVRQTARGSALWTGKALRPLDEGEAAALLGIDVRKEVLAAGHASFAGGMGELVDALVAVVGPRIRYRVGVTAAQLSPGGRGVRLAGTGGQSISCDGVVVALPAYAAARLFTGIDLDVRHAIADARYDPSLTVSLAYDAQQIGRPLEGTGVVVARDAGSPAFAVTYASNKFPGRAPAERVLLRVFLAPVDDPAAVAHDVLAAMLGISGKPLWTKAYFWRLGLRRPSVHWTMELAQLRERLAGIGPITLAGGGFDGPGVSGCVRSGREAGRRLGG